MGKRSVVIWLACGFILGFIVAVVGIKMRNRLTPSPVIITPPEPTPLPTPTAQPALLRIYINGAVLNADVYEFPAGSLLHDAVQAAGGFAVDADDRLVNLALPLSDGMHIYIPTVAETQEKEEPPVVNVPVSTSTLDMIVPAGNVGSAGLININTAGSEDLEDLPGIGPALAQRIIEHRNEHGPFETIEAIQDVSGIGPATFDDIKDQITVE